MSVPFAVSYQCVYLRTCTMPKHSHQLCIAGSKRNAITESLAEYDTFMHGSIACVRSAFLVRVVLRVAYTAQAFTSHSIFAACLTYGDDVCSVEYLFAYSCCDLSSKRCVVENRPRTLHLRCQMHLVPRGLQCMCSNLRTAPAHFKDNSCHVLPILRAV